MMQHAAIQPGLCSIGEMEEGQADVEFRTKHIWRNVGCQGWVRGDIEHEKQ